MVSKYQGPYEIVEILFGNKFALKHISEHKIRVAHSDKMKIFKKTEMSIDDSEILCENISADREENSDTDEDVNSVRSNQDLNHQMNLRPRQPINYDETN